MLNHKPTTLTLLINVSANVMRATHIKNRVLIFSNGPNELVACLIITKTYLPAEVNSPARHTVRTQQQHNIRAADSPLHSLTQQYRAVLSSACRNAA